MNHSQIATVFDVEVDSQGVGHVTASNFMGTGRIGGTWLKQYSGDPADMRRLASRLQKDYERDGEC